MDAGRGSALAMMSFHDFGHAFHRFGVLSFADGASRGREEKDAEEAKSPSATAMRKVFEDAKRGSWPGNGDVSFVTTTWFPAQCRKQVKTRSTRTLPLVHRSVFGTRFFGNLHIGVLNRG